VESRFAGARHRLDRARDPVLSRHRSTQRTPAFRWSWRCRAQRSIYFTSGPGTRKSRNLADNPACTLSLRLDGIDLILEDDAHRVVDRSTLDRVAATFHDGGWPAQVDGDVITAPYSAQSAGPPPWYLYRIDVQTAFGVGLREPHGASRWRF
jgi:hypothetical protein